MIRKTKGTPRASRIPGGALTLLITPSVGTAAYAQNVSLFPSPLHLTREITDPVSRDSAGVDECCFGNTVVSISGEVTSIANYDKGELVQIDRKSATCSVTSFSDIANPRALPALVVNSLKKKDHLLGVSA